MRLIPAIDLRAGRCVRLLRGDFGRETRYERDPAEVLEHYRGLGAEWIHVVDLDGAGAGDPVNRELIASLAERGAKLQVGGGLRAAAAVTDMLALGAARVVIGSAAVTDADAVRGWLARFGAERVVLAFDVRLDDGGTPRVATHGWKRQSALSLWEALSIYGDVPPLHVLCTDVNRDGALEGPNVPLYAEAARRFPAVLWQASGGVRDARDLRALERAGAAAAVSGKALLEGLIAPGELRPFLPSA